MGQGATVTYRSAVYRSVIDGAQIALPLMTGRDEIAELRGKMPDRRVLLTLGESAKEYSLAPSA